MKLEQLKAAYEAATHGAPLVVEPFIGKEDSLWIGSDDAYFAEVSQPGSGLYEQDHSAAQFIALAHNTIPLLLEAVELLRNNHKLLGQVLDSTCYGLDEGQQGTDNATMDILEKLK